MSFVKLDTGLLNSTLWAEHDARDLFITALLMAEPREFTEPVPQIKVDSLDQTGFVVPPGWYGFVRAAGIGIIRTNGRLDRETGLRALAALGEPDNESRSSDYDGRRMVRVDGGFIILNYVKYRDRDRTTAERSRRWRIRQKERETQLRGDVSQHRDATFSDTRRHQGEVEVEGEAEADSTGLDGKSSKGGKNSIGVKQTAKGTPHGLNELQYATRLIEEIKMPDTPQNLKLVAAGIKAEQERRGGLAQAYEFLLAEVQAEIERKGTVNGFWFQDAKWREKKKPESKGILGTNSAETARKAKERLKQ